MPVDSLYALIGMTSNECRQYRMQPGKEFIVRSSGDVISDACSQVTTMIKEYMITTDQWPLMQKESPEIQDLEWLGPLSIEETERSCHALVLNHELMFKRRAVRRKASVA